MFRFALISALLASAACVPANDPNTSGGAISIGSANAKVSEASCKAKAQTNCAFVNGPVRLGSKQINMPGREFPFYETVDNLDFIDAVNQKWAAPASTLTDGASIPPKFVEMIGDPTSREFINAATVHDAYCGTGNEAGAYFHAATWPKVHRMFYDALRVGGTPRVKAKIMYAAVFLGGPRWVGSTQPVVSKSTVIFSSKSIPIPSNRNLFQRGVPTSEVVAEMKRIKFYIEVNDPPIAELERHLRARESDIARVHFAKITADTNRGGNSEGGTHGEVPNGPNANPSSSPSSNPSSSPSPGVLSKI